MLQTFKDNIDTLYRSSEAIALLDMLASLAACNISFDYGECIETTNVDL
jgi:DNA mismatch repair protein MSH4